MSPTTSSSSFTVLYLARSLAAWGERTWQFVAAMFLLKLDDSDSLQLVAIYGLISCLALMVLGNVLGWLVDTLPRDRIMVLAVITQNISVSLTCCIMTLYFSVSVISPNLSNPVSSCRICW